MAAVWYPVSHNAMWQCPMVKSSEKVPTDCPALQCTHKYSPGLQGRHHTPLLQFTRFLFLYTGSQLSKFQLKGKVKEAKTMMMVGKML